MDLTPQIHLEEIDDKSKSEVHNMNQVCSNINNITQYILLNISTNNQYPTVFTEKIGLVVNHKISLKLRPKAKPIFNRERDIPYALREKVEKELDNLEAAGITFQKQIPVIGDHR